MPQCDVHARAYKETTLHQLRSLCETARLGSFTAAATALGLSHPTVWKQVHALEREFGAQLVKPYSRGCRLTEAGRTLAELAAPAVASIAALKQRFQESLVPVAPCLTVVTTPRILVEDLPGCVLDFQAHWPNVQLSLQEQPNLNVAQSVQGGQADLGLVMESSSVSDNSCLMFEPAYELDIVLITPLDHPLARRRHVRPRDLCDFPIVNSPNSFKDSAVNAALEHLGVFERQTRRIEAYFAASIRRYVELGFGIGLLPRAKYPVATLTKLHERVMSQYFGRQTVYLVSRKSFSRSRAALDFAHTLRTKLSSQR